MQTLDRRMDLALASGDVILRGLNEDGSPLIIERDEADFVQATLDDLAQGLEQVRLSRAVDRATIKLQNGSANTLKLYHPAGRVAHLALFELVCNDGAYEPRLNPRAFLEGCLVIRRISARGVYRWGQSPGGARGWSPVADQAGDYPDPAGRPPLFRTGDAELDRELAALYAAPAFDEARTPLFLAPPEINEALGRTVVYAVIPTSSAETSAAPPPFATGDALRNHLPSYLRGLPQPQVVGRANTQVAYATIAEALASPSGDNGHFLGFVAMVRQLVFEFGVFEAQPAAPAQTMLQALGTISLRFVQGNTTSTRDAASFLREASEVLVTRRTGSLRMPADWPAVGAATAQAIQNAAAAIVASRAATARPQEGRYANPRNRYTLRAFARVRHHPGCPPDVVASPDSEPFCIAPWYESKGAPTPIVLPEMNMDALKRLKPNVAFVVPSDLQALLDSNDAKDLADGKGKKGAGLAVDWICSFSLPVITLCAFIVLNIFLQLFNIVFQWMLWLKICIPLPRPAANDE
ncbi:MAG: hypothetical protein OHK0022_05600 [Roseiflexaceae bacterium]